MQTIEGKPEIIYPTQWEYRIIGRNKQKIKELIPQIVQQDYEITDGKTSSGGKFVSVVVRTQVQSEEQRDAIFVRFKQNPEVDMVL